MAHLQLLPVAAPALLSRSARPPRVRLAICDGGTALWTADGLLRVAPTSSCGGGTFNATAAVSDYAVTLLKPGGSQEQMRAPWSALCALPALPGLLLAQEGSCKLLFCQHPNSLGPGEGADIFLIGRHEAPITSVAASPCGSLALSGDLGGGVALWSLADGRQLSAGQVPGSGVASVCWLAQPEGCAGSFVATAAQGSSVVQLWSVAGGQLQLAGELDGGSCRAVRCLCTAGPLLAVGCVDGSTLLWHAHGGGFEQHAMLPGPAQGAAVVSLSFSPDGSLLAVATACAAGDSPAVAVFASATGLAVCQQELQLPPALLLWAAGSELWALLEDGTLVALGEPHCEPGLPLQSRHRAQQQAALSLPPKQKKTVRFCAASPTDGRVGLPQVQAEVERAQPPHPTLQKEHTGTAVSATTGQRQPGRRELPPLPSHPRLSRLSGAMPLDAFSARDNPLYRNKSPVKPRPSAARSVSSALCAQNTPDVPAGPNSRCGGGGCSASQRQPLYPILDLRALQGLPTVQAGSSGGFQALPAYPTARGMSPSECLTASVPDRQPPQGAAKAAAAVSAPGPAVTASSVQPEPPVEAHIEHEPPVESAVCIEHEPLDEACPRQQLPPAPCQRKQRADQEEQQAPGRVSKQRCDACHVLAAAAAREEAARAGRPGPCTAAPDQDGSDDCSACGSSSTDRQSCTRPCEQPVVPEAVSHDAGPRLDSAAAQGKGPGPGTQHLPGASSTAPRARQQRFALLKRHAVRASATGEGGLPAGSTGGHALPERVSKPAHPAASKQPEHLGCQQMAAEESGGRRSAADGAPLSPEAAGASQEKAAAGSLPQQQGLQQGQQAGGGPLDDAAVGQQLAALVHPGRYAIDSDAVLSDGEGEPEAASCAEPAAGEVSWCGGMLSAEPDDEVQGGRPRCPAATPDAFEMPPRPLSLVPAPVERHAALATTAAAAVLPPSARHHGRQRLGGASLQAVLAELPSSWSPAADQLGGMVTRQQQPAPRQAKPIQLTPAQVAAARRRAATAATTLPRHARMYPSMRQPAPAPKSAAEVQPRSAGTSKAAPLAAATKRRDESRPQRAAAQVAREPQAAAPA